MSIDIRKVKVKRVCNHRFRYHLIERGIETDEFVEWLKKTPCDDCRKKLEHPQYPTIDINPARSLNPVFPRMPVPSGGSHWGIHYFLSESETKDEPEVVDDFDVDDLDLGDLKDE